MALSNIRQRMAFYGAEDLLALLPSHESMDWIPHPAATPSIALVIGTHDGRDTLAFIVSIGDKSCEVRYCSKPCGDAVHSSTIQPLTQDEVVRLPLHAPFKYNTDISQQGKSNFSIVIQWYFMGLRENGMECDYMSYCPQFYDALKKIDAGQHAEKEFGRPRKIPMRIEKHPEPENPRNVYGLHSAPYVCVSEKTGTAAKQLTIQQLITLDGTPSAGVSEEENADLDKLHKYLDSCGARYLLANIPEPNVVQFVDQDFLHEALPKKLFVGRHAETLDHIYAYMRPSGDFHEIKFYIENTHGVTRNIPSKDVANQSILHPFDKTYPKASHSIDQAERARLTLLVKWYFIAAGIAKNCVLRETKTYPERLRSALEYVAKRMGSAAVRPSLVAYEGQTRPETTPEEARLHLDESHIQSTLAEVIVSSPITSRTTPPRPSTFHAEQLNNSSNTVDASVSRGTKRTAEDTEFEDLAQMVSQVLTEDRDLTNKLNDIDEQIKLMQMQRKDLVEKRKDIKKRFKRHTLAVAARTDSTED